MTKSITLLGLLTSASMGAALSLDLQPTGGTTAAGYLPFEHTTQTAFSATGTEYAAFGTTVTVIAGASGLENELPDQRSIQRNGSLTDINNDWLGVDGRNGTTPGQTSFFTLSITGLPAGQYVWTSVLHDGGAGVSGAGQGNIFGNVTTSFTDALGTVNGTSSISAENPGGGAAPQPKSSFVKIFTADGNNPVSLTLGTTGAGTDAIFALTSSLVISDSVPEPSSALLGGIALLGLLRRRR
ncbi:PEP-CTERM sorting domain-containing protein [Verrucomicrobiaceae bacterium 227]